MLRMFNRIEEQLHKGTLTDDTFKILQKHYDAIGLALKSIKPTEPEPPTQPEQTKDAPTGIESGFFTNLFSIHES